MGSIRPDIQAFSAIKQESAISPALLGNLLYRLDERDDAIAAVLHDTIIQVSTNADGAATVHQNIRNEYAEGDAETVTQLTALINAKVAAEATARETAAEQKDTFYAALFAAEEAERKAADNQASGRLTSLENRAGELESTATELATQTAELATQTEELAGRVARAYEFDDITADDFTIETIHYQGSYSSLDKLLWSTKHHCFVVKIGLGNKYYSSWESNGAIIPQMNPYFNGLEEGAMYFCRSSNTLCYVLKEDGELTFGLGTVVGSTTAVRKPLAVVTDKGVYVAVAMHVTPIRYLRVASVNELSAAIESLQGDVESLQQGLTQETTDRQAAVAQEATDRQQAIATTKQLIEMQQKAERGDRSVMHIDRIDYESDPEIESSSVLDGEIVWLDVPGKIVIFKNGGYYNWWPDASWWIGADNRPRAKTFFNDSDGCLYVSDAEGHAALAAGDVSSVAPEDEPEAVESGFVTDVLRKSAQVLTAQERTQVLENLMLSDRDAFVDLWLAAVVQYPSPGQMRVIGGYDYASEIFTLSGVEMPRADAVVVFEAGRPLSAECGLYVNNKQLRVNLPNNHMGMTVSYPFYYCTVLQVANADNLTFQCSVYGCPNLHTINHLYDIGQAGIRLCDTANTLVNVTIDHLTKSIDLSNQPRITYESFRYIVDHAANTSAIVIRVTSEVYAKLTDANNTLWHEVLTDAMAKNITFGM